VGRARPFQGQHILGLSRLPAGLGIAALPDYLIEENTRLRSCSANQFDPARYLFLFIEELNRGAGAGISRLRGEQGAALAVLISGLAPFA
jgi:hypothetical protein